MAHSEEIGGPMRSLTVRTAVESCQEKSCTPRLTPPPKVSWPGSKSTSYAPFMAIMGAHVVLYTSAPQDLREVFRDVFGFEHVDVGDGWLIFALPPAELGIHPAEGPTFESGVRHQLTLMCDDIGATIDELRAKGMDVRGKPEDEGWGITITLALPGDVTVMLYEPRHPTAI